MNRRQFMLTGAAAAVAAGSGCTVSPKISRSIPRSGDHASQIALILYTIRDYLKTPQDMAKALARVSRIGYRYVEVSCCEAVSVKELAKMLKDNGLNAISGHRDFNAMLNEPQKVVDHWAGLDCRHIVCAWMPNEYPRTEDGFKRFAVDCNKAGKYLSERNVTFAYHNHSFEFHRFNGLSGLEILLRDTCAKTVKFELDTFWIQHGGGSPAAWLHKVVGRCEMIHCKDFVMHQDKATYAEVGEGNLDWPAIIKAAHESKVRYFIVEQDRCLRDPMESIEISYKNMRAMGL